MKDIIITDVRCNPGDSAFLIDTGEHTILYDTGFGFTGYAVADKIKEKLGNRPLDYIFLTHSHYDHALGSAYILRRYPDARVVAGKYAAEIFRRAGAKLTMKELDNKIAADCNVFDYEFLGDELRVDIPVSDGDIIHAGRLNFKVIELPGHTKCSVGFYCPELKLLLSSESLGVYDGGSLIVPSYLISYKSALESMRRIRLLDIQYLLAPHYGLLTPAQTVFFLSNMEKEAEKTAALIINRIKEGKPDEEIISEFKDTFWHGYIKEIYPIAAVDLNTSIIIKMIRKEFAEEFC